MGNWCSPCCRKSHKTLRDDDVSNYGTAASHHNTSSAGAQQSFTKGKDPGYAQYPNAYPPNNNGDLRNSRVVNLLPAKGPVLSQFDDGRAFRYNNNNKGVVNSHISSGNYVIVTEPSHYMLSSVYSQSGGSNLQHISEREPDDLEEDPSLNPTKETLFMQRSVRDGEANIRKRRSLYERNVARSRYRHGSLYRSCSCSTIRLDDSTVTRPDPKSMVRALACAVCLQIKNRDRYLSNSHVPDIFDERLHPIQNEPIPADYGAHDPEHRSVYRFIRTLFQMAQLSPECAVVTMVYLERLLTSAEAELTPATWKRMVLGAILLASKVWDDQAVWNVDYCQILKDLNVNDVNELERHFLEIIQFNTNVPSSVYAKYYFDLRSLAGGSCQPFPLSMERAHKLEAFSRAADDPFYEDLRQVRAQHRWGSLDTLTTPTGFRPAVLS